MGYPQAIKMVQITGPGLKVDAKLRGMLVLGIDCCITIEAVTILMREVLVFPNSPDLYNSFGTLFVCFKGLRNQWW